MHGYFYEQIPVFGLHYMLHNNIYVGKKSDVIMKEKMYLNGTYTPFQSGKCYLTLVFIHVKTKLQETDIHSESLKNDKGKRKRKLITGKLAKIICIMCVVISNVM